MADKLRWQNLVAKILIIALPSTGFQNVIEPSEISRSDSKRQDGMTMIPWSPGKYIR